ncbi:MAG: hypothetical protein IKI91_06580 [Clostridia bacterium]|nr:hypothetical protein [Clostridia bacterium]
MLPVRLAKAAVKTVALRSGRINEIRIRTGRPLFVTMGNESVSCGVICRPDETAYVLDKLCGGSMYSHGDTIREGFVSAPGGIRAGICGRAVTRDGRIDAVTDVTSIMIRIPQRAPGAADSLFDLLGSRGFCDNALVYSLPGVGKTTLLRELICLLASGGSARRVAVVDTRFELGAGIEDEPLNADFLLGYPRGKGIEIATRTMAPQFIVCDEIASSDDARAVEEAASSGVRIIASIHAGTIDEARASPFASRLTDNGFFTVFAGLSRDGDGRYSAELTADP